MDKQEFFKYRLSKLQNGSIDYQELSTSGSALCKPKKYKWGPDFKKHHAFYNQLFYDNQKHHTFLFFMAENSAYIENKHEIRLVFNQKPPRSDHIISNRHICCNPEVLHIYISKYGDFLDQFLDKKSCIFSFTSSPLTELHKSLFDSIGITYKDHMRCWDGGATYYTCKFFKQHWVDYSCLYQFEDGKVITTDLWNQAQSFYNYWNGDQLTTYRSDVCECGLPIDKINWILNPRYFLVKGKQYSHDRILHLSQKFGTIDFLNIEFSDELVKINICKRDDFEKNECEKTLSEYLNTKVLIHYVSLPNYSRKYIRIKKLNSTN